MKNKLKVLVFDIETSPIQAWIWRLGDQVVRHDQLVKDYASVNIMCIGYKWVGEPGVRRGVVAARQVE